MSTKELYQRFARLCQRWPKDESKSQRDFAEIFRKQLNDHFPHGDLGQVQDPAKVARILEPLERLARNHYFNENPLKRSSASGLDIGALREAISNEGLRVIQEQDEATLVTRLKTKLSMQFSRSKLDQGAEEEETSQSKIEEVSDNKDKT